MEPCFKQHTAVDDKAGVIVDATVTTGETSEGEQLLEQIKRVREHRQKVGWLPVMRDMRTEELCRTGAARDGGGDSAAAGESAREEATLPAIQV